MHAGGKQRVLGGRVGGDGERHDPRGQQPVGAVGDGVGGERHPLVVAQVGPVDVVLGFHHERVGGAVDDLEQQREVLRRVQVAHADVKLAFRGVGTGPELGSRDTLVRRTRSDCSA